MNSPFLRDASRILDRMKKLPEVRSMFGCSSEWIEGLECGQIYVRFINNKLRDKTTFVISNIEAFKPGQGYLTTILPFIKEHCLQNDWNLEFENVLNESLLSKLLKDGFTTITNTCPPCLVWTGDKSK